MKRILFTGDRNDPNRLPAGFLVDTQRNSRHRGTFTFFFNHDVIHGCPPVYRQDGPRRRKVRDALPRIPGLGLRILAYPEKGFARYHPCEARPSEELLRRIVRPHRTVLIDVVLRRIVHRGAFEISAGLQTEDFKRTPRGAAIDVI
jgi:hypothetical protein